MQLFHSETTDSDVAQRSNTRSAVLCGHFGSRKRIRIICLSIVACLIILGVIIPTTIIMKNSEEIMLNITATITISTPVVETTTTTRKGNVYSKWIQNGITVAGGNQEGSGLIQLSGPYGIYIDDDQSIYIPDLYNHRIVKWKYNALNGEVVAGGNREGNRTDQLFQPTSILIDKSNDVIIICDSKNKRVVQWLYRNRTYKQTLISNINCFDIKMDNNGDLYISDAANDEVRRWEQGETHGTIVAGGNGKGDHLNQLNSPRNIFIDRDHSVYVSDYTNNRVMKWLKGAIKGIIVAGQRVPENNLTHLSDPHGLFVDQFDSVYIADTSNHRIMRWSNGSTEGSIIVGGNGRGRQSNQLDHPASLSFDQQGNLYVIDTANQRVQKFDVVD